MSILKGMSVNRNRRPKDLLKPKDIAENIVPLILDIEEQFIFKPDKLTQTFDGRNRSSKASPSNSADIQ